MIRWFLSLFARRQRGARFDHAFKTAGVDVRVNGWMVWDGKTWTEYALTPDFIPLMSPPIISVEDPDTGAEIERLKKVGDAWVRVPGREAQ